MELQSLRREVETRIGEVATHPKLIRRAEKQVDKKLGAMLYADGEVHEIAADAISEVVVKLLTSLQAGSSNLSLDDAQQPLSEDILGHAVAKYIIDGVNNYCKTRLYRWSLDQKVKKKKETLMEQSDQYEKDEVKQKKVGARSRIEISAERNDDSDFWDQHIQRPHEDEHLDASKVARILVERGLSKEQIVRLSIHLDGMSFAEMARQFGGTEGKYRNSIEKALEKAGLEGFL